MRDPFDDAELAQVSDCDETLVDAAVEAGGRDNVTAIVVQLPGEDLDESLEQDTTPRDRMNGSTGESRS